MILCESRGPRRSVLSSRVPETPIFSGKGVRKIDDLRYPVGPPHSDIYDQCTWKDSLLFERKY